MRRRVFLIFLIGIWMLFPGAIAEDTAVRVENISYSARQVQGELDVYLLAYSYGGTVLTAEQKTDLARSVADAFAVQGLVEMKLRSLNLAEMDDNTVYALRAIAQEQYDAYWQKLRETDSAMTDAQLTAYMTQNGLTLDKLYEELRYDYLAQRFVQYCRADTSVTDAEAEEYFLNEYVRPYRERYEKNIPLFEDEVLYGGGSCLYTPEGYRIIRQILLPIPEELQAELDGILQNGAALYERAQEAYNDIAAKAVAGEDVTEERALYLELMDQYDQTDVLYGEAWAKVLPACQPTVDEIFARLESGERFDSLMNVFGTPSMLYYHPDSAYWSDDLKAAAETLQNVGDVSQPVLCSDGLHILCYAEDVPGGAAELENDEQRQIVRDAAEQARFNEVLHTLTEPLREEYPVEIDLSRIVY